MDIKRRQNLHFCKGDIHYFGQKVEVFSSFVSIKNTSKKVFAYVLDEKEAFKDYKKKMFIKKGNLEFFQRG